MNAHRKDTSPGPGGQECFWKNMPLMLLLEMGRNKVKGIPGRGSAWGNVRWQKGQGNFTE